MTDIVISRVDAAPATFEAAKFLRLFRGTLLAPGLGILPWTTTVTIDDREPLVHTNESIQEVLDKLAGSSQDLSPDRAGTGREYG